VHFVRKPEGIEALIDRFAQNSDSTEAPW